jgi:hypothetical protein
MIKIKYRLLIIFTFFVIIFSSSNVFAQDDDSFNFGEGIPLEFEGFVQQDIGYAFYGTFFANKYTINLGDDVNLNWNFSGNSVPSSVNINGIYQDNLSVGSATAAPRNNTQYVITASNIHHTEVLNLDVRVEDWNLSEPSFSNWLNSDPGYNYTDWLPGNNVQTINFNQNRNYSQNQGRISFEREFDNINEEYRFTGNRTVEDRTISVIESRLVNVVKTTTFIDFVDGSCGLWSPDVSTINSGTVFTQTRNCKGNYSTNYSLSNGYDHSIISSKGLSQANNSAVGTKSLIEKTGLFGNIALIGTNGLTASSYSVSSTYQINNVKYLFDGFTGYPPEKFNADTTFIPELVTSWMCDVYATSNQHITIDFGSPVSISGIRVHGRYSANAYHPKDIIIKQSTDGVSFTNHHYFTLPKKLDSGVIKIKPMKTRYFRFHIINNFGGKNFVGLDELEVFN